jgi:hypothetical protein
MSEFRWQWWRIGIADPQEHKEIEGWRLIIGQLWWKTQPKPSHE